jgi:hypothetical protein
MTTALTPNCHLWQAATATGGTLQVLVPFGEDEQPHLDRATDDDDVISSPWVRVCVIYGSTIDSVMAA